MSGDQPDTNRSSSDISNAAANPNTNPNKKLASDWAKRVPSFIAGIAAVWITNTWGFMQERTFGAIESERDAAIEELESIRPIFDELSTAKPIRAQYGNTFEALHFVPLNLEPSEPISIGDCNGKPCLLCVTTDGMPKSDSPPPSLSGVEKGAS